MGFRVLQFIIVVALFGVVASVRITVSYKEVPGTPRENEHFSNPEDAVNSIQRSIQCVRSFWDGHPKDNIPIIFYDDVYSYIEVRGDVIATEKDFDHRGSPEVQKAFLAVDRLLKAKLRPKLQQSLPDGWFVMIHDGYYSYYNARTGEYSWDKPTWWRCLLKSQRDGRAPKGYCG